MIRENMLPKNTIQWSIILIDMYTIVTFTSYPVYVDATSRTGTYPKYHAYFHVDSTWTIIVVSLHDHHTMNSTESQLSHQAQQKKKKNEENFDIRIYIFRK